MAPLAMVRDWQDPAGFPALAAARSTAGVWALQADLPVCEERASGAIDFPDAAFPARSAAWSFVLRGVVPLLAVAAELFAPVEE